MRDKGEICFREEDMEPCLNCKFRVSDDGIAMPPRGALTLYNARRFDLEFTDVSLNVSEKKFSSKKKSVLKSVSGRFKSGELTAIMGPSGAGKSSLLRVLTGFITSGVEGSIKYTGSSLAKKKEKTLKCFIMQDDYLAPLFTVNEIMNVCASLKLGDSLSPKARQLLVEDILDMMGLMKCKSTRCGKLSGGQSKRLSIALELVDNPPVMFLDEPTTGLDSVSSLQCIKVLKALARGGRTIIITIHQPCATILDLLDHVYIMREGYCVYQGSSHNMLPYLSQFGLECPKYHNPADFMMESVCGEYGSFETQMMQAAKTDAWLKKGELPVSAIEQVSDLENELKQDEEKNQVPIRPPSELKKFMVLMKCYYILLYRDWTISHLKAVISLAVGIFVGATYYGSGKDASRTISNLSYFFVASVFFSYTTMMPAIMRFPLEKEIIAKERFNNWYKLKTYFLALTLSSIPIQLIFTSLFVSSSYMMTSQPMEWCRFAMMMLMCFMCVLVAESFGLLIGTLCRPVTGTFFGALFTAYMVLFAGFCILRPHISRSMYWMTYIGFITFCFDGLVSSVYGYERGKISYCPPTEIYCHYSDPEYIMREMGITGEDYWFDFGVLLLYAVSVRFIAYYSLKRTIYGH